MHPPEDLMAIQNVVTPRADWEAAQSAVLLRGDSVVVQAYSRRVDSQELVLSPGPTRLPASKARRKTELP